MTAKPLFDAFRDAMMANPIGSRKEQMDYFIATMHSDPDYLEKLAIDYFDRMAATWVVTGDEADHAFVRTEVSLGKGERISAALTGQKRPTYSLTPRHKAASIVERRQQRETAAKQAQSVGSEMKARLRNMVLLDLELPNGKVLRHATGADCAKAGGFYAEIAKHLKPTQVVDRHLSENDLQNLRARFFQANIAA